MKKLLAEWKGFLMSGISYMIPTVIGGAMIVGIPQLIGMMFGVNDLSKYKSAGNVFFHMLYQINQVGWIGIGLVNLVIAGYVAYAIGDKPALVAGFIGGQLATTLQAGFLGALASGLIAGYVSKFMFDHIHLPDAMNSVVPVFLVPVLGSLITLILIQYVVGGPFAALNSGLASWLKSMTGVNKVLLAAIVGGMVGFDLGGPVNKAAVTTAMALLTSGVYDPNTAAQVAIIIPPIGLGLATMIDKKKFTPELNEAGKASFVMGLIGVSEGAIPFAIESPLKIIPINVIGSALGSAIAVGLGAVNKAPISGFYGWFAVNNWPVYLLGIFVGSAFVTGATLLVRKNVKIEEAPTTATIDESQDVDFSEEEWES